MKILMVCLGNICRSPLAEGILRHQLKLAGIQGEVDSAGTGGWHSGEQADPRSIKIAARYHLDISEHRARKVSEQDLRQYDLILAMDQSNHRDLLALCREGSHAGKIHAILPYAGIVHTDAVPDPYYGELPEFDAVYKLLDEACALIIKRLQSEISD